MHTRAATGATFNNSTHTHSFFLSSLCLCVLSCSLHVDSIERERGRANGKHCAIGEILGGTLALQLAIKRQAASTLQAPRSASQQKQLNRNQKTENRKFIANESHDKRAVHKCHSPLLLQSQQQQQQQILTRIVVIVLGALWRSGAAPPTNSLCRSISL